VRHGAGSDGRGVIADWASPADAAVHFASRLAVETDVSDVEEDPPAPHRSHARGGPLQQGRWDAGHVPGALHPPGREIAERAPADLDRAVPVVTYCWGPGCNGATRAALALSLLGYRVREMLGGFEYWAREGLPVATPDGVRTPAVDPLTACGC
jgi:rhodanese-related sulfurtransferase